MLDVLIALLPCLVCGVAYFGLYALLLVFLCMAACFAGEQLYNLVRKKPFTFDLSALVTGMILGLNLPPRAPWYIPLIGGVFAIVVVKMFFGGLGKNFANPAAAARVFLLLAYGSVMASYIGAQPGDLLADGETGATWLSGGALAGSFLGVRGYWGEILQLFLGNIGGSIGETCKLAVFAGGVYLLARKVIDWRIPLVCCLTAAVFALFFYGSARDMLRHLLSGGLLFGSFFMATDYATSPKWKINRILYAFGIGALTMIIRRFGIYPEGMSLAILFMNLLVPVMDRFILPVRFGQTDKNGRPVPHVAAWTMRGLCIALAAVLAAATPAYAAAEYDEPQKVALPASYSFIRGMAADRDRVYYFTAEGEAYLDEYNYTQPLAFEIEIDTASGVVRDIRPITQSTMGYKAELSLFIGKTYEEVAALTDLSADSNLSATFTNTALKGMVEECFLAADFDKNRKFERGGEYIVDRAHSELFGGTAFLAAGSAYLSEYDYTQPLLYYIVVEGETVSSIVPLMQSTMGYTAELSLFLGKTRAEIEGLTDLSADSDTSATHTNQALKEMVLECLAAGGEK